jgi:hypothetical protein
MHVYQGARGSWAYLFGDGDGAFLVETVEPGEEGFLDFVNEVDGSGGQFLKMPAGGSRMPASHETIDARQHFGRHAVEVGGVRIEPGDLVFGDADGVVAIPKAIEVDVLKAALEKVLGEHKTLAALKRGEKLATVFARYGVL